MLKVSAWAAIAPTAVNIVVAARICRYLLLIFSPSSMAGVSVRDDDLVGVALDVKAQEVLRHAREAFDVVGRQRGADGEFGDVGIGDDDLTVVVAVVFGGDLRQRCVMENEYAAAPAKLRLQRVYVFFFDLDRAFGGERHVPGFQDG